MSANFSCSTPGVNFKTEQNDIFPCLDFSTDMSAVPSILTGMVVIFTNLTPRAPQGGGIFPGIHLWLTDQANNDIPVLLSQHQISLVITQGSRG